MNTSSPRRIPTIPDWTPTDQASWLIGAARDRLQKSEAEGEGPETLMLVIQAHALLGVAAEKLRAAAVAETQDRRIGTAVS